MTRTINAAALLFLLICFSGTCQADVPPDPGYKRVSQDLILEPQDEFPEYRFFIKSGADLVEVSLNKGERRVIEPIGGGAWYRSGTLLAVPKKSIEGLSETPTNGKLSELQRSVYDGRASGSIELIKHTFIRDVRAADAPGVKAQAYRLEKDTEKGIRTVLLNADTDVNKPEPATGSSYDSNEIKTPIFWVTVIGGSLMTLAFIGLGVWFVRRSRAAQA